MTQAELKTILDKHEKWLNGEEGGERADLHNADLRDADLHGAGLSYADLHGAVLGGADLSCADLHNADLSCADLHNADLCGADLSCADLHNADLSRADLGGVDLSDADLHNADLSCADLDFSCLPLWYGSLYAHFDDRQIAQIVYHAVKAGLASPNVSDEVKTELRKVAGLANRFHRVDECGRIEEVQP